ncbi:MAG: DUF1549 domain-containing protein, partial [Planctomycetales bacterium]|nr:DUF1549 domain-containing protein [Planctomycetales bacterium]
MHRLLPAHRVWQAALSLAAWAIALACAAAPADDAADEFFRAEVRPLLKNKCLGCHGEGKTLESEYDMRSRESVLRGGELGVGSVPGKPEESPIYTAVIRSGDLAMPPKEVNRLSPAEIAIVKRWVEIGLPWADGEAANPYGGAKEGRPVTTSGGLDAGWTNRRYTDDEIWAYQPLRRTAPPGQGHLIDAFLAAKLKQENLSPAPPADKDVWLRRATFDLTGLPPTPQQLDAFAADNSPEAFDRAIDRLLASQHYGERMAQHWLDVVRYADTGGFANDWERPHAWRYRDYVIRSFNADKPFDQFTTEQIAGDELNGAGGEGQVAVGFLRMGPWEHTAMSVAAITRQQYLDDVTNAVGLTFLGQGMSCCQCHDHKFDPLPTRDYYRLQAVFATTVFEDRDTPFAADELPADADRRKQLVASLVAAEDWMETDDPQNDSRRRIEKKRREYSQ